MIASISAAAAAAQAATLAARAEAAAAQAAAQAVEQQAAAAKSVAKPAKKKLPVPKAGGSSEGERWARLGDMLRGARQEVDPVDRSLWQETVEVQHS